MNELDVLKGKHDNEVVRHEIAMEKEEANSERKEHKLREQEIRIIKKNDDFDDIEKETKRIYHKKGGDESDIPEPPTPPEPPSPLDHAIEMA